MRKIPASLLCFKGSSPHRIGSWMIRWLKLIVLGLFAHHALCTALYVFMPQGAKPIYHRYVIAYMTPLFYQHWELFAEPPGSSQRLVHRCYRQGEWGAWQETGGESATRKLRLAEFALAHALKHASTPKVLQSAVQWA